VRRFLIAAFRNRAVARFSYLRIPRHVRLRSVSGLPAWLGPQRRGERPQEAEGELMEESIGRSPARDGGRASPWQSWEGFLRDYSGFILGCIRRFTVDPDERMDMYAHVCARLRADECRRLQQFRGMGAGGSCKFTTWLATVTLNLCREWIRSARGRRRLYRSIERLSAKHALVFKHRYWHGFTSRQILELIRPLGYARSIDDVEQTVAEIEKSLNSDHRWRILARKSKGSPAAHSLGDEATDKHCRTDQHDFAEQAMHREHVLRHLRASVAKLPAETRSVLDLRYREGLTARAVAHRLEIRPYKRVYEIQTRGLRFVRDELEAAGITLEDVEQDLMCSSV